MPLRCFALALCAAMASPGRAGEWPQFGYDAQHSGYNPAELSIDRSNVAQLALLYAVTLHAVVDSAPVYRSNVLTAGGHKDLLFVLSKNGRLSALDAGDGSEVWSKQISGPLPTSSSPALDPDAPFVYSYGLDGYAHKYRIGDGGEISDGGWPQPVTLKPSVERVAAGLTIATPRLGERYLYVATNGYNDDSGDYQGHLVTIDLSSGAQNIFNTLCSDLATHFVLDGLIGVDDCAAQRSGIWGRGGAVFDGVTNRVYVTTGNGQFNANDGGFNWSDSVLALDAEGRGRLSPQSGLPTGLPYDSYTPDTFDELDLIDGDLGSISLAILPTPLGSAVRRLGLQTGKDAMLRLIDLSDMSGAGVVFADGFDGALPRAHVGGELQLLPVWEDGSGFGMKAQPAVWVDAQGDGSTWAFVSKSLGIAGFQLVLDDDGRPALVRRWAVSGIATSPILANGLLFVTGACSGGNCVVARDPLTGDVLWSSPIIGGLHWQSPILVDGKLFIVDANARLWAFGLGGDTKQR